MNHIKRNPLETRVVITGIGAINPLGNTVTEYFKTKKMPRRLSRFIVLGHIAGVQAIVDSGIE